MMATIASSTVTVLDRSRMDGVKMYRLKFVTSDGLLNYDISTITPAEKAKMGFSRFIKAIDVYAVDAVDFNTLYAHVWGW